MSESREDKNEVAYYPEVCIKLKKYLQDVMPNHRIAFSQNKILPAMVKEIYNEFGVAEDTTIYYPSLKTDIAFGFCDENKKISLMLIEVKRGKTLALMNFSQLVGYMQVAKHIKTGLLLLVNESKSSSPLSTDFSSIVSLGQLPADWKMIAKPIPDQFAFKTGVCVYTPGNGIDWVDSNKSYGISDWDKLVEAILD